MGPPIGADEEHIKDHTRKRRTPWQNADIQGYTSDGPANVRIKKGPDGKTHSQIELLLEYVQPARPPATHIEFVQVDVVGGCLDDVA